jgi:hypothetical protein
MRMLFRLAYCIQELDNPLCPPPPLAGEEVHAETQRRGGAEGAGGGEEVHAKAQRREDAKARGRGRLHISLKTGCFFVTICK